MNMCLFIHRENETNKLKLQKIQVKLEQIEAKEQETLNKLKESLAITEQDKFERVEAIVERDQIKIELVEIQKRLKKFLDEINDKVINEKQNIEVIYQDRLKENTEKIRQIEEQCTQYELTIDRLTREKISLATDIDVWKERFQQQEIDLSQTTDSIKHTIQKSISERDQANSNTIQIRSDFEKLLLQSNQDLLQLRYQLSSTQNRLNDTESELLQSKKQCLDLTKEINRLTQENIMLKSIKQSLERSREENMNAILVILNKHEQDYRTIIENLELERHQSLSYLENLVHDQNTILNKLQVTIENQELHIKLLNAYEHLEQFDSQLLQHYHTHIKLQKQIIDLNNQVKTYKNIINKI
ncbi:unnamed protein product [Rotaria sp. Silwood1]|nr:unnamed protein product [Rotaria sp. Silwood1]CAF3444478.1 unnamed protein product [Rotaria sp. Silwood1]CAF4738251.1 unnamed protein product [Rotaria sp. Silwood1]